MSTEEGHPFLENNGTRLDNDEELSFQEKGKELEMLPVKKELDDDYEEGDETFVDDEEVRALDDPNAYAEPKKLPA